MLLVAAYIGAALIPQDASYGEVDERMNHGIEQHGGVMGTVGGQGPGTCLAQVESYGIVPCACQSYALVALYQGHLLGFAPDAALIAIVFHTHGDGDLSALHQRGIDGVGAGGIVATCGTHQGSVPIGHVIVVHGAQRQGQLFTFPCGGHLYGPAEPHHTVQPWQPGLLPLGGQFHRAPVAVVELGVLPRRDAGTPLVAPFGCLLPGGCTCIGVLLDGLPVEA